MAGNAFRIDFDPSELNAELDKIEQEAGECVRPAAQAGAAVLYSEAKYRAPVLDRAHWFYGTQFRVDGTRYWLKSGALRDAIYHVYSEDNSEEKRIATYHIAWNHQKAPHGFMVEFGTSRAAANPFLRPAYDATKDLSLTVARDKFVSLMESALPGLKR